MHFELKVNDMRWMNGMVDDPADLCLHGKAYVKIGDTVLDDGTANDWAVSAGAYRMLESLYKNHIKGREEHLLPCCGHFMFIYEKTDSLIITGCPKGIDWSIVHENGTVKISSDTNAQAVIPFEDYKAIVFGFADTVKSFYDNCSPKNSQDAFENQAYQRFWENWRKIRSGVFV
ncbi:MAG: hypothetical protein FWE84_02075 [Firmicutes bacterium]|nr:hypothetical protein [Bacillota bacterium]